MIELRGVSKVFRLPHERRRTLFHRLFPSGRAYELFPALTDVSLDVARGEFVAVLGANGSGKSTLLRLMARIYPPSSGSVRVSGSVAPILELGAGFQRMLSVRDNVLLYGVLLGVPRRRLREEREEILARAGVARFADARLDALSTGLRARLALTLALAADAEVLLIDEALAVGDEAFNRGLIGELMALRARGRTLVFVTHNLELARTLCGRAVVMQGGRVQHEGPTDQMIRRYQAP